MPRALEQRAREERGRRLAVGAGDPRDPQRAPSDRRRSGRRRRAIARPHVVDDDLGHAEPERPLHDERHRAARDRVGREVVPVAREARDAEEQGPGTDEPVVERQARDDHVGAVPEQLAERHAAGSLRVRPGGENGAMPERRTLTDADGTAVATFTYIERDGRRVADLLELEVPVERAVPAILRAAAGLPGGRSGRPRARAGRAAGGKPARHAHVYSHDLAERPEPSPPPGIELTPVDRPVAEILSRLPGRPPARARRHPVIADEDSGAELSGHLRPVAAVERARGHRRRARRGRDPGRRLDAPSRRSPGRG